MERKIDNNIGRGWFCPIKSRLLIVQKKLRELTCLCLFMWIIYCWAKFEKVMREFKNSLLARLNLRELGTPHYFFGLEMA